MVSKSSINPQPYEIEEEEEIPPFKWTSIALQEFIEKNYRLNASGYGIEGRQAREDLKKCKWDVVPFGNEFIKDAFYLDRFKRIYVDKSDGIPFILPSQITEIYPKPTKFISPESNIDIESTKAKQGQVLLTRSGTVGVVSYVTKTLRNQSLSDDVIRIEPKNYSGYVYTYLKSYIGNLLVQTNNYGAVIKHIEPKHLNDIPIPNPPPILKQEIHNLIEGSFKLRDESNDLMDEVQSLLKEALQLPDIEKLQDKSKLFDKEANFRSYSVPLSKLDNRLDSSYHISIVQTIEKHLRKFAKEITHIGDSRITQSILLPGRFKRVYVQEGNGVVFFGGKQIYELDPKNKKYLSLNKHSEQIKDELKIHTNTTLITRSGTIGKVVIVPEHWDSWIPSEHVIRIVPTGEDIAGYLYSWLSSDYAYPLITRYTYGAVVDEIDDNQVSQISIPLLQDDYMQKQINDKVLETNQKRTEAYELEQKALDILSKKVIYAQ